MLSLVPSGAGVLAAPRDLAPAGTPSSQAPYPSHCSHSTDALARADELLGNVYRLGSNVGVTLPSDLTWAEDPLKDRNWQFQLHAMNFTRDLLFAASETGEPAYLDRAVALFQDWIVDNPKTQPPSEFSWNDHSTAWRAYSLACAADVIGPADWLVAALDVHGATLADPAFYVAKGNHALDQATALLEVGRVLARSDWMQLATDRINTLVAASIDDQGVTNEQSVGYQVYNWRRYVETRARLVSLGLVLSPAFARVDLMPGFLAHATLPNGEYEMLGDSSGTRAEPIPGTTAEFAATGGASGPKPAKTVAVYRAGFLFSRTGWGETRPFADEMAISLRWGPAPAFHGHADGLAMTMYGYGKRLLTDSGAYSYDRDAWRSYFKSRRAHNVVTVDGLAWNNLATTTMLGHRETARLTYARLTTQGYNGVTHTRRVLFSQRLGYAVVEDRLVSATPRTYRQLWHLLPESYAKSTTGGVITRRARGNVLIRQLIGGASISIVRGETDPIQGWVSFAPKQKQAAPVVEAIQRGGKVRYLTLVVPAAGAPAASVTNLQVTANGYRFTITIGGRTEQVVVDGTEASIR